MNIEAEVPQWSILGSLFLIYINDFSDDLIKNIKLFASNTSLFSVVHDVNTSTNDSNNDISKIKDWIIQWKMSFNPDPNKQAPRSYIFLKTSKSKSWFNIF